METENKTSLSRNFAATGKGMIWVVTGTGNGVALFCFLSERNYIMIVLLLC